MSEAYNRGHAFEMRVAKQTREKLHLNVRRDNRSGAGIHKQDVRDRYNELPVFIECKDQETTKLKEWWREADAKSSFGQAPVVVFPDQEEVLCVMRYSDLLNFVRELFDWKETAEDLRMPEGSVAVVAAPENTKGLVDKDYKFSLEPDGPVVPRPPIVGAAENIKQNPDGTLSPIDPSKPSSLTTSDVKLKPAVEKKIERGATTCRNGHIADGYGYCMQLDCKYSRGYRKPKVKK